MPDRKEPLTATAFAQKIKAKYPDYKDVPDLELAQKIVAKYPEYRDVVTFDVEKKSPVGSGLPSGSPLSENGGLFSRPFQDSAIPSVLDKAEPAPAEPGFRPVQPVASQPAMQTMEVEDTRSQTDAGAVGQEAFRAFGRGLTEAIPSTLESIAVGAKKLDELLPESLQSYDRETKTEDLATWRLGRKLRSDLQKVFPRNPALQDNFLAQTAEGLGQVGAMVLTRRPIAAGALGVAQTGSMEYREALDFYKDVNRLEKEEFVKKYAKEGNDTEVAGNYSRLKKKNLDPDEEAFENWMYGSAIGATEFLPVLKFLRKADEVSGGQIKKTILKKGIEVGKQGIEEALQEGVSEYFSNLQARETYDATRDLLQGVGESAKVGGAVGAILQLMLGVNTRRMQTETDPKERAILKANQVQLERTAAEIGAAAAEPTPAALEIEQQITKLQTDLGNPAVPQEVKAEIEKEVDRLDKKLEKEETVNAEGNFDADLTEGILNDIATLEESLADPDISDEVKAIMAKTLALKRELLPKAEETVTEIKEEPTDAIQIESPAEGMLRDEGVRGESGLPGVVVSDQPEVITEESISEEIPESKAEEKVDAQVRTEPIKDSHIEDNYKSQIEEKGYADVFIPDNLAITGIPDGTYKVRIGKSGGIAFYDVNGKKIGVKNRALKKDFFDISRKVVDHFKSGPVTEEIVSKETINIPSKEQLTTEEVKELIPSELEPEIEREQLTTASSEKGQQLTVGDQVSFTDHLGEPETGKILEIKPDGTHVVLKSTGVKNNLPGNRLTKVNTAAAATQPLSDTEVLKKAEEDLSLLKKSTQKGKKYDGAMKRLTDARKAGTITESEFTDLKDRFDDVIAEGVASKDVAAKLRSLKIDTKGKALDATLGLPASVWNGAVETVATAIEAGVAVADAIKRGINYIQKNHRGPWNKKAYSDRVIEALGHRGITVNGEDLVVKPMEDKATVELVNGFYSPLEKAIVSTPEGVKTGRAWAKILSGATEADEMTYTGVGQFLKDNADRGISKKELSQFMKDNRIEIVEIVNAEPSEAEIEAFLDDEVGEGFTREEAREYLLDDQGAAKFSSYQLEGDKENYREVLVTLPQINKSLPKDSSRSKMFLSSHFDEPNILVHLRMNTRTDAEGNKVLFLEEIQSDWGQKGKREGFKKGVIFDQKKYDTLKNKYQKSAEKLKSKGIAVDKWGVELDKILVEKGLLTPVEMQEFEDQSEAYYKTEKGVPKAPFVTDTNSWVKLGLKVALKEAEAQGVDKIAWTTGEQQNDRYDLSKQVDYIDYWHNPNGTYGFTLPVEVTKPSELTASELENYVGKEVAQKIVSDISKPDEFNPKRLEGNDLKVGGKGMKGFYGSPAEKNLGIIGNVAKSLFKQEPKTTEIKKSDEFEVAQARSGKWMATDHDQIFKEFNTEEEAINFVRDKTILTQHSIDVTPELKEAVKAGLPLFKDALAQAKENLKSAKVALDNLNRNLGIASDPEVKAKALFEYHKALVSVAKEYVKKGIRTVEEFATAIGEELTQAVKDAWNEAGGGRKWSQEEFINRELYPSPPPPEMKPTVQKVSQTFKEKAKTFYDKWLTYRRGLPREVWKEKEATIGEIAKQINQSKITATKLDGQIEKQKVDTDTVDAALRGDSDALLELPQDVQQTVTQMRSHIDTLSQYLIDNGLVSEGRQQIIASNIGEYLNRSYKLFNSKDWTLENVPQEIYNKAAQFLYKDYYPDIKSQMLDKTEAEVDKAVQQRVKAQINEYFNKGENAFVGNKKIGSKDLSILKKRKDVPPELRALFGEVTDPVNNYVQTVFKLANLAENARFLTKIKADGMGTLFFEEGDPARPETHHVQIAAEGSDTMSPLNGLYTTPELAEAFKEQSRNVPQWVELYLRLTSLVKAGKTIGSVVTHLKNVEGNIGIALMNGHLDPTKLAESYKATRDDFLKADTQRNQEIIQKLIQKGVLNQNIFASEIRDMFDKNKSTESFFSRSAGRNRNLWEKTKFYTGKAADRVTKLYEAEDNFFKINAYLQDRQKYAKAEFEKTYEDLTDTQKEKIDTRVTELIKNTYPTYSRVPPIVRAGSALGFPLLGNFVAFASESYRIGKNMAVETRRDLLSSNPDIRKIGAQRLAGIAMYGGLKGALLTVVGKAGLAGLAGLAGDDEEERKNHANAIRYVAPWSRNSDLIVLQADEGKLKYVDLSSYDPFGNQSSILNAVTNPGTAGEKTKEAIWEFIQPFADPDITAKAINAMINNQDSYGRKIYEEADDPEDKTAKLLGFALKSLEPGTVSTIRRVYDKDSPSKEFGNFIYRTYEVDVAQAFGYKMRDHKKQLESIGKTYTHVYYDNKATEAQKQKALDEANAKANILFKTINKDYKAALDLGVRQTQLSDLMKNQSFNSKIHGALRSGKEPVDIIKKKPALAD